MIFDDVMIERVRAEVIDILIASAGFSVYQLTQDILEEYLGNNPEWSGKTEVEKYEIAKKLVYSLAYNADADSTEEIIQ